MSECGSATKKEASCVANFRNVLEDNHFPRKGRYHNALVEDSANDKFYLYDACGVFVQLASGGTGTVYQVNGKDGIVVLTPDDFDDTTSTNKFITAAELNKLAGIEAGAQVNAVTMVNGQTGVINLTADDIDDLSTTNKFVTAADITNLANLSGTNSGDQAASAVPFTPNGDIAAVNVQTAIVELRDDTDTKLSSKADASTLSAHVANTSNPHAVSKAQVGLGSVPNIDATLRSNHTGTQLAATISDFDTAGWVSPPATAASPGTTGQRAFDSGFFYICVATDTWLRTAITTW